jgi:hypothetical protein
MAIAHNGYWTILDCTMALFLGKTYPFPHAVEHGSKSSSENQKMELRVLGEVDLRNRLIHE